MGRRDDLGTTSELMRLWIDIYTRWLAIADANPERCKVVVYEDLLQDVDAVMSSIGLWVSA